MKLSLAALAASGLIALSSMSHAATIELDLTATWVSTDFDVSSTGTDSPSDPMIEENDDLVFGIAPSSGSVTFTLLVNTASVSSFLVGGPELVQHDHFGYTDVTLKSPVTLGSATWNTDDILTGLIGPGGVGAALWTDKDLLTGSPTLASFRAFGDWTGTGGTGLADVFFGSRIVSASGYAITNSFLTWEYFDGEEIRKSGYTATASSVPAVPLPASSLLLLAGLGGFAALRRKSKPA